ncbi:MAG: proton-conducting transporter membrane subunit [bacterium]|nr:proton-conducting transporter membrane subunit [bacterium]
MNNLIILPVAIYLGAGFLISLLLRKDEKSAGIVAISFVLLATITSIIFGIDVFTNGRIVYFVGGWEKPLGIVLMVDPLSSLFIIMTNFIALLIMIYSFVYIRKYTETSYFYIIFLIMLAGMNGVLISMDIFNIYVFFEIASIASFILVAFGLRAEELEASMKYTVMSFIASTMILFAIALIYGFTGTLNIATFMSETAGLSTSHLWFLAGLLLSGFALKAALVPFHTWLPDAHSMAPAPISAILSGMFIKVIGLYVLIRITNNIFIILPQIRICCFYYSEYCQWFSEDLWHMDSEI